MPASKLIDYLDKHKIRYEIIPHQVAYTAQGIAASAHIPGKEIAKTVMVKLDGNMAMAVLPASYKVDLVLLKEAAGAKKVRLAGEEEFKEMFPECDVGAMPPFGGLYGLETYVAESLTEDESIAFNAGSHRELIRISFRDYRKLVKPRVMRFSYRAA